MKHIDCQLIREAEHFIYIGSLLIYFQYCPSNLIIIIFPLENQFL
jgi:hypothetical protein